MDLIAIKGALDGVSHLKTLLSTIINEKNEMAVRERVMEMMRGFDAVQEKLFEAREDAFKLQQQNFELLQKIHAFEDWSDKEKKYELKRTAGGAYVHELIATPKHYACPSCFAKKTTVPLQDTGDGIFSCPSCHTEFQIGQGPHPLNIVRETF